jgi:hypothetical protein
LGVKTSGSFSDTPFIERPSPFDWINRLPVEVRQLIQAEMSFNLHIFRHRLPFLS